MNRHQDSLAARRIALGLELGVATSRDLTDDDVGGAAAIVPKTVTDQIADVGTQLYTILAERLGNTPDTEQVRHAQREARETCARLRAWMQTGVDEHGAPLSALDRHAIDRLLRDVAFILARVFGYGTRERVELRTSVLGETPEEAAEHVRRQDANEGNDPGWRWSLDEQDGP